ncbi:MAG: DUF1800 family protein [Lacisediminihabitans sp.]
MVDGDSSDWDWTNLSSASAPRAGNAQSPRRMSWRQTVKGKVAMIAIAVVAVATLGGSAYAVYVNFGTAELGSVTAEYLARRVLLDPTPADIAKLATAPTAADAVNELFQAPSSSDATAYNAGLAKLTTSATSAKNPVAASGVAYAYQLVHDPNQATLKLYYLWENIFSVDAQDKDEGITYSDVDKLHSILYKNATGSYLTMLKDVQTNYALDRYLNLTQSKKASPNENFSRELMQVAIHVTAAITGFKQLATGVRRVLRRVFAVQRVALTAASAR